MSDTLKVLRLEIPPFESRYPMQLEIWLDPNYKIWCIGPPRAATSSAELLMQVDPHQFFTARQTEDR